jgi:23S rRNA pseudouridine1911/1915/1917 synthase
MIQPGEVAILFEDTDLVVVNKPAGVVVNQADTHTDFTIQDWMVSHLEQEYQAPVAQLDWDQVVPGWQAQVPGDFDLQFGTPEEIFSERKGMVHRLDKDTSGALVLAKHPGSLMNLLRQFKDRQVEKTYHCLVHGKFGIEADTISFPIGRASRDRKIFDVRPDGREAVTTYQVKAFYPEVDWEKVLAEIQAVQTDFTEQAAKELKRRFQVYQGFSLVECQPKTGRTHQIRVHMAHLQHPLVGDTTYIGRKRQALDPLWCPRQFLHASRVEFKQPRVQQQLAVEAPLAADLAQVLAKLNV